MFDAALARKQGKQLAKLGRWYPAHKECAGFHGVNERIAVEEYAKSIGFFHQLMYNPEDI